MRCEVCEAPLQAGTVNCPNCGMPVSYNHIPSSGKLPAVENNPLPSMESPPDALPAREASPPVLVQPHVRVLPHIAPVPVPAPRQARSPLAKAAIVALLAFALLAGSGLGYYYFTGQPGDSGANTTSTTLLTTPSAATVQAEQTAITTAPGTLYSQSTAGNPTIQDQLSSNNTSAWETYSGANGQCAFNGGAYHINSLQAGLTACFYRARAFVDFTLQVQMTITKGDAGGMVFRFPAALGANASSLNAYMFIVNVLGVSSLVRIHDGEYTTLVAKTGSALGKGVNQTIVMTVIARGSVFFLYVNKQFITTVKDTTYQVGFVGLVSLSFQDPTEVAFHNAQIWP